MEEKKKLLKNWKLWAGIVLLFVIVTVIVIFRLRNKMTPEETVSKFMHQVENKQYEEAKNLCSQQLDYLDLLSNVKPSNLHFEFSEDKKNATAILLEDEIENTNLNITMKETLLGWKIESYNVTNELIDPQIIEDRLIKGDTVSDVQLLYWGESDIASKDEIIEYVEDNGMATLIFLESMKLGKYDKANELYQPTGKSDLSVEQLKEFNWSNYKIMGNLELMKGPKGNLNSIIIELEDSSLGILVAGRSIVSITNQS